MTRVLEVAVERWPIAGSFVIARGAKTEAVVVTALIRDGTATGRGEAVPYARYGESVESVTAAMQAMAEAIASGVDRAALQALLPPGAARNALDCALWDLEAKLAGAVKNKSLPLILVCQSGARSGRAVVIAKKLGFEQAHSLGGGLASWKAANLPIEKS